MKQCHIVTVGDLGESSRLSEDKEFSKTGSCREQHTFALAQMEVEDSVWGEEVGIAKRQSISGVLNLIP